MKKTDKDNLDFIRNKFEEDNLKAPGFLDETGAYNLIESKKQKKIKFYKRKSFKTIVSLAACFAVVVTSLTLAGPYVIDRSSMAEPEQNSANILPAFTSYEDIQKTVKKTEKSHSLYGFSTIKGGSPEVDMAAETVSDSSRADNALSFESYGETYKQVDAVDEADIIKNNGEYIFWRNGENNVVNIYKGTRLISVIDDFEINYDDENVDSIHSEYITDMFVYDNRLVLNNYKSVEQDNTFKTFTATYIYDISDIESPKEINRFSQSGSYISSRMIGSQLYIASNDYIYSEYCRVLEDYVPTVCEGKSDEQPMSFEDIYCPDSPSDSDYLIISSINVDTGKKTVNSKALFGGGSHIYCNENNMYVAMNKYVWKSFESYESSLCQIVKVQLGSDSIDFTAAGEIKGNTNNQFSMDEKDGYLRIATTTYGGSDKKSNNLFILDENLKTVGEVTGFARNEEIKAVRFIGNTAYVITYEQTDPLFVIDVSDPSNPEIKGSVEITGFSSLLVPVDENTLLGIGYETKVNDVGITTDGIKLALFDISNPESPSVLDSFVMENADSEAQYNHHALVVNKTEGYYAIPYNSFYYENIDGYDEYRLENTGVLMFGAENGKIVINSDFNIKNENNSYSARCTYIGDTMYLLSDGNPTQITEFKIK